MDGWTSKFLEVVFKHLVHIYCDYSTSNIFAVRGEKDCPSGELEREFNSSFFFFLGLFDVRMRLLYYLFSWTVF